MIKKVFFTSFLVVTASLSHAENMDGEPVGSYVSANVGYANVQNWWTGSLALTVNGGYQFNRFFATEVGATWINGIPAQYPLNSNRSGTYGQNQSFFDVAAKGSLPFSDIFNVYIKGGIGVGLSQTDAVSSGQFSAPSAGLSTGLYLALGGEFKLTNNLQLVVEDYGMLPFVGDYWGNINVMGAGLKYNF